jgi:adenosine/AMP kinase
VLRGALQRVARVIVLKHRLHRIRHGAGHSFIVFLGEGYYPINVLNTIKNVPEVCRIFCATANPTEVIIAETEAHHPATPPAPVEMR